MRTERYDLMHKNDVVASLSIEPLSGLIDTVTVHQKQLLPLGTASDAMQLRKWWLRRATPISQGNFRHLLQEYDIATPQSLLVRCLGLSLSDHYWIRPAHRSSELTWESVSLFSNPFSNADKSFQAVFSPDLSDYPFLALSPIGSMTGEMQKKWIIENGKRRLLKRGAGTCQQAVNEVISTQIHTGQKKFPFAQYELCQIEGDLGVQIGCLCDCFATEQLELIPAIDVIRAEKRGNDISYFQHFIDLCVRNGLDEAEVRAFLEYQILSDFVITNVDRHYNNFGVLRDSSTLRFVGMAPIFDSGNSMFWSNPKMIKQLDLLSIPVNSFERKEIDLLRYVNQPDGLDLSKLPSRTELQQLMTSAGLADVDLILDAYERKIQYTEQLQRGEFLRSCKARVFAAKLPEVKADC